MDRSGFIFCILSSVAAVYLDIRSDKIPNWLVLCTLAAGWCVQIVRNGVLGVLLFCGGAGLPILLGAVFYYFRMVGAGDLKLLAAVGCFMGPVKAAQCVLVSVLAAGVMALFLVCIRRNLRARLQYFVCYAENIYRSGKWRPYLNEAGSDGDMHFSIAVCAAVLFYAGGVY